MGTITTQEIRNSSGSVCAGRFSSSQHNRRGLFRRTDERLGEAEMLVARGNDKHLEEALNNYDQTVSDIALLARQSMSRVMTS